MTAKEVTPCLITKTSTYAVHKYSFLFSTKPFRQQIQMEIQNINNQMHQYRMTTMQHQQQQQQQQQLHQQQQQQQGLIEGNFLRVFTSCYILG